MTHFYDTIIQTPVQLPKSLPLTLLDFESKRNLFFIEIAFCFVTMTLINYVSLSVLSMKLPSKLGKEPLVTVLFEIRFTAKLALSNILPGILFSKLGCENIEPTPHAQIPEQIRRADPNLKYLPLVALKWQRYQVLVGDSSVVLSCDIPYLGWTDFRTHILSLINELEQTKLISEVERYSLKYVDVIENVQNIPSSELLKINLKIGDSALNFPSTQLKTEMDVDGTIVLIQILGQARALLATGQEKDGVLVDMDTINLKTNTPLISFIATAEDELNSLHLTNMSTFFSLLSEKGLESLEPEYDDASH